MEAFLVLVAVIMLIVLLVMMSSLRTELRNELREVRDLVESRYPQRVGWAPQPMPVAAPPAMPGQPLSPHGGQLPDDALPTQSAGEAPVPVAAAPDVPWSGQPASDQAPVPPSGAPQVASTAAWDAPALSFYDAPGVSSWDAPGASFYDAPDVYTPGAPAGAPPAAGAPFQPAPTGHAVPFQPAPTQYAAPVAGPYPSYAAVQARPSGIQVNENFLGRNILPLVAAALALVGLVFLGILVVPHLTEGVRITLMFVIAGGVTLLGYLLGRRHSSVLTQALTGTGLGGLFIAIMVTHLFFHAISDVVAFVLLAVWIAGTLWLSKHVESLLIAILAHVGLVISIVTAYAMGLSPDRLVLLLVYQIVVTVAITLGDYFWVRSLYRYGLFAAQALILVAAIVTWTHLMGKGPGFGYALPTGLIVADFVVQFLGATAIAYLLFTSCARIKSASAQGVLGAVNASLWAVILLATVTTLVSKLTANSLGLASQDLWVDPRTIPWSLVATLVLAFVPVVGLAFASQPFGLRRQLHLGTAVPLAVVSALVMVVNAGARAQPVPLSGWEARFPNCAWIIVLAAGFLVVGLAARSRLTVAVGAGLLALDWVLMLAPGIGYDTLAHVWTV